MIFKDVNVDSKEELDKYFEMVDYEACEYCFITLYLWQHVYQTKYYIGDGFAVIMGEYEDECFSILPLAPKDKLQKAIEFVVGNFRKEEKSIYFRGITKEVVQLIQELYPNEFDYKEERDLFDYIYEGESLRCLSGKKNQKKRNHLNYFLKEYKDRHEYRRLNEDNFDECIKLIETWTNSKEENLEYDEGIDDELIGIKKIFKDYEKLKDKLKIAGVYIDGSLVAFTMGEFLNPNMALIHIEKADSNIRGLYPYINQKFIVNEFEDVQFVNREEDLGIQGLRKSKLSYHPIRFVEKYSVRGQ